MLKQAIIEQWKERFDTNDPSYSSSKIKETKLCADTSQLLYHCMNIDLQGRHIIASKLKISHRDFAFFLSSFRALDQGHIFKGGKDGFCYKKKITIRNYETILDCIFPDEIVVTYVLDE